MSLENVSKIYRYGFFTRYLKLGIKEFLAIKKISGIDPFHELENVNPSILEFINVVNIIKGSKFKINTLTYFLKHDDLQVKLLQLNK